MSRFPARLVTGFVCASWAVILLADPFAGENRRPLLRRAEVIVNGEVFDLAAHLVGRAGAGEQFWLVQLAGPTQDAWLDGLRGSGLVVLQYYPHYSYLVWGNGMQSASARLLAGVVSVAPFPVDLKATEELRTRSGRIANVDVMFYNDGVIDGTIQRLQDLGGEVLQYHPSQPDGAFYDAILTLDREAVGAVAEIPSVLWLGYESPRPVPEDEMSDQILGGNYTDGEPFLGYFPWLGSAGVDGTGVIWAVIDTGISYGHPDLNTHIVGGYSFPGACGGNPGDDCLGASGSGHGTFMAGVIGGDASAGFDDSNGFFYGLGMAPNVSLFAMNPLLGSDWPPAGGWQENSKRAVLGGAVGGNNSWFTGLPNDGYQAVERTHDFMVRDGNFDTTTVAEPLVEVFTAGNSGSSGLSSPSEAKNLINVGSSRNFRAGSIDDVSGFSSQGPAHDGRWEPTVVAPGEFVSSTMLFGGETCATAIPGTASFYSFCSGSSVAAAHASGALVLLTEWWRQNSGQGADPSPALAKALLVNSAVDMPGAGTGPIPNIFEGWGRIHLPTVLLPAVSFVIQDQGPVFTGSGQSGSMDVDILDPSRPLKITLAWSDAPGAVGANPALVNNLDLEVVTGGKTYRGNVFDAGWSTPGGTADAINNLENVYVESPGETATITVLAMNIAGDGVPYNGDSTDQDYAFVCQNCGSLVFSDGFESGDTSAWSNTVP